MEILCVYDVYRECDGVLDRGVFPGVGWASPDNGPAAFAVVGHRVAPAGDHVHGLAYQIYGLPRPAADICSRVPGGTLRVRVERQMVPGGRVRQLADFCRNIPGGVRGHDRRV